MTNVNLMKYISTSQLVKTKPMYKSNKKINLIQMLWIYFPNYPTTFEKKGTAERLIVTTRVKLILID